MSAGLSVVEHGQQLFVRGRGSSAFLVWRWGLAAVVSGSVTDVNEALLGYYAWI
jgi:hypothetical protein